MKNLVITLLLGLFGGSVLAQTKPLTTSPTVVSTIESITAKHFQPDTAYAALTAEDDSVLVKQPTTNWGLPMESGKFMTYYNLVVGTRSYQLLITKAPTASNPTATLLRFLTPKSKPEPIARGILKPKEEKPK